jgi:peptidoglycan-associated lipoprotein
MIHPHRPFTRALLIFVSTAVLFAAACNKKPPAATPSTYTPPASTVKPTVTLTADRANINQGESAKLSWTSTDAVNVSISPEVGAVTLQGTTTVTPAESTTYTVTASGPGGNADATARITVNVPTAPATVTEAPKNTSFDQLFMQEVRDAYFDLDSAEIRPDAREALQKTAAFLKGYPNAHVTIEGHCDERGSTEYNLALGDRRANAVKQYLVNLGIPAANLNTVSYGKEKPFCMESSEACWQQNRRGHFVPAKP